MLREYARFWIDPQLGNLELLRATYTTYTFVPHTHETFAIGITEVGAQEFTYQRRRRLIMPEGSIAVVNPGEVHTSRAADSEGWSYRMLYPDATYLQRAISEISGRQRDVPFFPAPVIFDRELAQRIRNLHLALEDQTTTLLERESRLLWTLALLVIRHADTRPAVREARPEPVSIHKAREHLDQHYAENVSLETLASVANLSVFHLLRTFGDMVGLPPHAYLIQRRVDRAKRLLLEGMPAAEVAMQVGFVDQSHLGKHFKRIVGVTPGRYQHSSKNILDRPSPFFLK
jgi:AraC-like DNA-binding protein